MKISDSLEKCAELISGGRWCRGYNAVDKDNNSIGPLSKHAYKFCAQGAIHKLFSGKQLHTLHKTLDRMNQFCFYKHGLYLVTFNDKQKRARPVIALFRQAARQARKEGL